MENDRAGVVWVEVIRVGVIQARVFQVVHGQCGNLLVRSCLDGSYPGGICPGGNCPFIVRWTAPNHTSFIFLYESFYSPVNLCKNLNFFYYLS